jgi:HK97 family phage major capsid protein
MAKWVELAMDWGEHKKGEKISLPKSQAKSLVAEQKAIETQSPEKRLINQAVSEITKGIQDQVTKSADESIAKLAKGVEEAQKRYPDAANPARHNIQQALGIPNNDHLFDLDAVKAAQIGRIVDGGLAPGAGPSNPFLQTRGMPHSGVGMGPFLAALAKASTNPESTEAETLMKGLGSMLVSKTPLAEASGVTGGYTVPIEYAMRLLMLVIQMSVVRPRATVIPMGARSIRLPALDVTTPQAAGQTAFLGGLAMYWTEEAATRTETEPQFRQIELIAHELSGFTLASNTLLQDNAVALDAVLTRLFSQAIAWHSDFNFLQGTGAGRPLGVVTAPATVSVTRNSAGHFKFADVATMISKLLTTSMGSAVWVCSQTVIPDLIQMVDGASRVIWIPNMASPGGGLAQTMPQTLLGLPIIFTEKLPPLGTKGDVILCDFSYYLIGDRMQLEIASSIHFKFTNNQTTWRTVARLDGQPWLDNPVTLADTVTLVSPFVVLN